MALRRLSTRLNDVLTAADSLKIESLQLVTELSSGAVSLGRLFRIRDRAAFLISTVCDPYAEDAALGEYADQQFPESPFRLLEKLTGIRTLLGMVRDTCDQLVYPYSNGEMMTDYVVIVNNVGVQAPIFSPEDTVGLQGVLQTIYDNIPQ